MKKKVVSVILIAILSFSLVACGNDNVVDNDRNSDRNNDTNNETVIDDRNEESSSENIEDVEKEPYNPKYELATGLEYSVNEDGTSCTITGIGTCELVEFSIPEEIDGYRVTIIGTQAFWECSKLTNIEIPDGVTHIKSGAFMDCKNLESIIIPNSVMDMEGYIFDNCKSLTSIELPEGITRIGSTTFTNCSSLTDINIPDSVTTIEMGAFYGCSSLTSIRIPDSVTFIGVNALDDNYLTNVKVYRDSYADSCVQQYYRLADKIEYID